MFDCVYLLLFGEGGNQISERLKNITILGVSFFCGALFLSVFATLQKMAIGAPLVLRGYLVPVLFGGLSGGCIGYYISKIKRLNVLLKERIGVLENVLSICSNCKKILNSSSKKGVEESWQSLDLFIAQQTDVLLSHGLCPDCIRELYPEEAELVIQQIDLAGAGNVGDDQE